MKTIIVTGGTRGIGRSIVETLAGRQVRLIITYQSNVEKAVELKRYLSERDVESEVYQMDLSDRQSIDMFAAAIDKNYECVDGMVNNAGMTDDGSFLTMDDSRYETLIRTNLGGTMYLTQKVLPVLLKSSSPAIVFLSSAAGVYGKEGQVPYSTTKGGVIGYCQLLGRLYSDQGLRANAVAPGFIETDMVQGLDSSMYQHVLNSTELKSMGKVEDVAKMVLQLLSPGYIQGLTIKIDGGFLR